MQKVNRDTCGVVFKASEVTVDGESRRFDDLETIRTRVRAQEDEIGGILVS